jgi:ABC-type glycerol-3-phosphate transport system permease component
MYFSGGMIPQFILMKNLNLINTRAILIIGGGLSVHNTILVRTYFEHNIPTSLFESARIDGASEWRVFTTIVLPLSTSIIATVTLYYAVGHWSDWYGAMIYTSDTAIQPLQLILRGVLLKNQDIMGDSGGLMVDAARKAALATTMKFGVVFVSCLPMLVAYPFVQKHFVTGRMAGSVKG